MSIISQHIELSIILIQNTDLNKSASMFNNVCTKENMLCVRIQSWRARSGLPLYTAHEPPGKSS